MKKLVTFTLFLGFLTQVSSYLPAQDKKDKQTTASKAALSALQEFVGPWKGNGETKDGKTETWKETMNWGWKLKGGDVALSVEFDNSKYFTRGELRFLPEKKVYQLKVNDPKMNELVFEGEFKRKQLELKREDPTSKDKQTLTISTNNDGARLIYTYSVQTKGKGLDKKLFTVQHAKEGMSLASSKKNECCVTGGLGTIAVSYGGKTYYVCCSGCRDAFNEDPKGIVEEYEKKKKKEK